MKTALECVTYSELLEFAEEQGYELDGDIIRNPGPFEGEEIAILYFHEASLDSSWWDELYDLGNDGSGCAWFELTTEDKEVLGWPTVPSVIPDGFPVGATHARLSWNSQGFYYLEYYGNSTARDKAGTQMEIDSKNSYYSHWE